MEGLGAAVRLPNGKSSPKDFRVFGLERRLDAISWFMDGEGPSGSVCNFKRLELRPDQPRR